jgi:ribosomal protection tetracycline resistance protein
MQILNLGILAHVDAGKTSLTERLLFDNGSISQLGSVDAGSTQTDSDELERLRGITIRSAVASFAAGDLQVNLVDTPGHPDFIAEVERALAVLDAAILVLSAVEGVQSQTRVLMKSLTRLRLPTLLFVNKIDRRVARQDDLLADIRRRLSPCVVAVNEVRDAGTPAAAAVPAALGQPDARRAAAEMLAEHDDGLLARLVDGGLPSRGEIEALLAGQTAAGTAHPLLFGSAVTAAGAAELVEAIRTFLVPADAAAPAASAGPGPRAELAAARGTVFAIERGDGGEKVAYLRLFSGELRERQRVTVFRREPGGGSTEFGGQITGLDIERPEHARNGRTGRRGPRIAPPVLTAGNIARVRGLPGVRVGDRLGEPGGSGGSGDGLAGQPQFPPPSLETIVVPERPGDAARLHAALLSLADEDPLIRARATGGAGTAVLLYGMVQQEVIAERLRRDFGVAAVFEPARPVYFERPAGTGEASEQIDRHGPNEFLATVGLRVEPASPGSGVSFTRQVELGSLPRAFHRAIEDTVMATLEQGLYGWAVTDCAVSLIQSGFSSPVSVAADFRGRTPLVLMRALLAAGTQVCEPCHEFEVEIPGAALTGVLGQLAGLGAEIAGSAEAGDSWLVSGQLPARLVPEFTRALPGLSGGEGSWWSRPAGDRPVRGPAPVRERSDDNPLSRADYLRLRASPVPGLPPPAPAPVRRPGR